MMFKIGDFVTAIPEKCEGTEAVLYIGKKAKVIKLDGSDNTLCVKSDEVCSSSTWLHERRFRYFDSNMPTPPVPLFNPHITVKDSCKNLLSSTISSTYEEALALIKNPEVGQTYTIYKLVPVVKVQQNISVTPCKVKNEVVNNTTKTHKGRKNNRYTKEIIDFAIESGKTMTMKEVAKIINDRWGLHTDETKLEKSIYNYQHR